MLKKIFLFICSFLLLNSCFFERFIHTNSEIKEDSTISKYITVDEVNVNHFFADEIFINLKISTNEKNIITKCDVIGDDEILNSFINDSLNPKFQIPITAEMIKKTNVKALINLEYSLENKKQLYIPLNVKDSSERIWPIKAKYMPLIHDFYLNSGGPNTIEGFTHNNNLKRENHYVYMAPRNHKGLDITAPIGTKVYAIADGIVSFAGFSSNDETSSTGYGNVIYLSHFEKINDFNIETRYAHLSELKVSLNDEVKKGDLIGISGNTGGSRIPHLHFEFLINNFTIDPLEYLPDIGFKELNEIPSIESNFLQSSLNLWNDIHENNWNYKSYVVCKYDLTFGGDLIEKGTKLFLFKRNDKDVFIEFKGNIYQSRGDNFLFTY